MQDSCPPTLNITRNANQRNIFTQLAGREIFSFSVDRKYYRWWVVDGEDRRKLQLDTPDAGNPLSSLSWHRGHQEGGGGEYHQIRSENTEPASEMICGSLSSRLCWTPAPAVLSDVENRWELGDGLEGRTVGTTIAEFYWWTIASNYSNTNQSVSWLWMYFCFIRFSFIYVFVCKTVDLKLNLFINNWVMFLEGFLSVNH